MNVAIILRTGATSPRSEYSAAFARRSLALTLFRIARPFLLPHDGALDIRQNTRQERARQPFPRTVQLVELHLREAELRAHRFVDDDAQRSRTSDQRVDTFAGVL